MAHDENNGAHECKYHSPQAQYGRTAAHSQEIWFVDILFEKRVIIMDSKKLLFEILIAWTNKWYSILFYATDFVMQDRSWSWEMFSSAEAIPIMKYLIHKQWTERKKMKKNQIWWRYCKISVCHCFASHSTISWFTSFCRWKRFFTVKLHEFRIKLEKKQNSAKVLLHLSGST